MTLRENKPRQNLVSKCNTHTHVSFKHCYTDLTKNVVLTIQTYVVRFSRELDSNKQPITFKFPQ
jgi:hypothetical protein